MSKDKMKTFSVWAKCQQTVTVNLRAMNLEEALQKAREMKEDEFVSVNGDYCDGEFAVTGVLENN